MTCFFFVIHLVFLGNVGWCVFLRLSDSSQPSDRLQNDTVYFGYSNKMRICVRLNKLFLCVEWVTF